NPDLPLAPASNMKLFSTAAALYYLGPSFRYSTYALADGEIQDGILLGDLVLYGTGDPTISGRMLPGALTPLRALADSLRSIGVTRIRGDVVGDGSYFDDSWIAEGWREQYRLASYSAPVGALSLAENVVSVRVLPGASAGEPAQIRTTPSTDGLLVQNRVRTIASGGSSVRFSYSPEGLVLEGQIARGHPGVARSVTVVDPGNYAAAAFRRILEDGGIDVEGGVRSVRRIEESPVGRATRAPVGDPDVPPPPRVIAAHLSPPLAEIATVANHVSQNLYAEALFKTVGRVALGQGTFAAGAQAVRFFLECERPIDFAGLNLVDGSGLSPLNRVTPRATIHLLDLMTRTDVWEVFHLSLPEAASPTGGQHSLRGRMGGTAAARNLRAKTGTISGVSGLSGYVRATNGELLAFSIYGNQLGSTWQAKRVEDGIGARLAGFSRPAPVPEPEPAIAAEADQPADPLAASESATAPTPDNVVPETARAEPAPAPAPDPEPATRTHRVARGEVLGTIARRYGTSVAELQRLNPGLEPRRIQIGQSIVVPGPAAEAASPTPSTTRSTPATPSPAQPSTRTHRVASGETLDGIARRYGTTVAELERLNPRIQPRRLQIGQTLTVPGR
ncbi:MAG TPA: D-alanyl-D-alanine carboxypeptidase/D-alanyl-D-alanine-endopeptidase, partial [Longimicrobiaceae bacterium]|nr:D-alanyl-D-alanine carboxypeptidase/D-alanyl-D-alanine-endopeptidase [Longimicrobiaceae bacterium]